MSTVGSSCMSVRRVSELFSSFVFFLDRLRGLQRGVRQRHRTRVSWLLLLVQGDHVHPRCYRRGRCVGVGVVPVRVSGEIR